MKTITCDEMRDFLLKGMSKMKTIEECVKLLDMIIEEFDVTEEEKETLSDAIEYLARLEDLHP